MQSLKDDRQIRVGDDRVTDVVSHPPSQGAAKGMAAVFDLQHASATTACAPVEVPRDRLFINAKVRVYRNQGMTRSWNPNVMR